MTPLPMPPDVAAVVCVPTYRRPAMLARTLASLAAQTSARPFRVVVVDNDARESLGLAVARRVLEEGALQGLALVEPRQGNCHAINAAFRAARAAFPQAAYLLMIDDDEVAAPDWLERMMGTADAQGADIVGGPVFPSFAAGTSASVARHPVFQPGFTRSGPVPRIYGSGNFLIRRAAMDRLADPSFEEGFNYLGGGDTDFFMRGLRAGLTSYWDHDARITEEVPPERTRTGWILRRCLRIGAINFRVERRDAATGAGRARVHLKNGAALGFGLMRGAWSLMRTGDPLLAAYRPVMALGRILASLGLEPQQYRAAAVPQPSSAAVAARPSAIGQP